MIRGNSLSVAFALDDFRFSTATHAVPSPPTHGVPVPATWTLVALAGFGLFATRRRKQTAAARVAIHRVKAPIA